MEGLEITIINRNEILNDNTEFRIDSEYYKKEYLQLYQYIKGAPMLDNLVYMSDLSTNGSFAMVAAIKNDSNPKIIPFIRSGNVGDTFLNQSELEFISEEAHLRLPKSTTQLHDIMMARKGKIGGASIIMPEDVNFNCNENVIKLDILDKKSLNPFYFTAYFNCKYGKKQIERLSTGNVQPWVSIFQIRKLLIPICAPPFQKEIRLLLEKAHNTNNLSIQTYKQAETLLLSYLGLEDFIPSVEQVNLKNFKESFLATGRLDAEYYQKKYDDLENYFDSFERKKLGDFITYPVSSGVTPKAGGDDYTDSESGVPFIRAVDLQNGEVTTSNFIYIKPNIHTGILKRTQLKQGDVLFSIAGTVGRSALFNHSFQANINQAVSILRFNDNEIKRLYIVAFFNSKIGKEFVSKYSRQGLQTNLNLNEVADLRVPLIDYSIQESIASLVEESFQLKKQSEELLERAKRAVEIAIEEGEEKGMAYLEKANIPS